MIIFLSGIISLKYSVEGEYNLPFGLSKISIISTIEGVDIEDATNKWNLKVNQNNDIYLHIKKNSEYKKIEIIENVKLENFNIEKKSKVGSIKLFKPDNRSETVLFKNIQENETNSIQYVGSMESNLKEQKISNQGGLVVFRYSITELGNYISNNDEEINHNQLLNKLAINNDDLKFKVKFDVLINLVSGKSYKSNVSLDLPVKDIVTNGTESVELTDLKDVVFKRL